MLFAELEKIRMGRCSCYPLRTIALVSCQCQCVV